MRLLLLLIMFSFLHLNIEAQEFFQNEIINQISGKNISDISIRGNDLVLITSECELIVCKSLTYYETYKIDVEDETLIKITNNKTDTVNNTDTNNKRFSFKLIPLDEFLFFYLFPFTNKLYMIDDSKICSFRIPDIEGCRSKIVDVYIDNIRKILVVITDNISYKSNSQKILVYEFKDDKFINLDLSAIDKTAYYLTFVTDKDNKYFLSFDSTYTNRLITLNNDNKILKNEILNIRNTFFWASYYNGLASYIMNQDGELIMISENNMRIIRVESCNILFPFSIFEHNNKIYFSTVDGLNEYDLTNNKIKLIQPEYSNLKTFCGFSNFYYWEKYDIFLCCISSCLNDNYGSTPKIPEYVFLKL